MQNTISVIKIGGTEGINFDSLCSEIAERVQQGEKLVIVHGGSKDANQLGIDLNSPPRFLTSPDGYTSRYTNPKTLEIFCMAVKGKVNTQLVSQLQHKGVNAFGLSGLDGKLIQAQRKKAISSVENGKRKIIRDDYSGKIEKVNTGILFWLLDQGMTPVIAPIAVSEEGDALNVDADRAAAMVAAALSANTLFLFTAVKGLMKNFPDESTWIPKLTIIELDAALQFAEGRMKKKVLGAKEALAGGVKHVAICDGRVEKPITRALAGDATWIGI
jgi:acetylglutamate/LysW-gamma-L-alpha-aminoadipate kinase